MRILLTNDDGISSPGIYLLAKSLRQAGHRVFMVAPDSNRSGFSHSIEFLNKPLKLKETEKDSYSCSGTPVDCVLVSILGGLPELDIDLKNEPDLVLSGINAGANLGTDIIYSGTASAARQGSFLGIPSIALSLVDNNSPHNYAWDPVISFITENLEEMKSHWKPGSFVNVNFLNNGKKPLALVPVFHSIRYYNDRIHRYTSPEGEIYCFAKAGVVENIPEDGSDWAEVKKGNAAFSLVKTQPAVYNE